MLSVDYIRNNKDKVLAAAKNKGREVELDKILALDDDRRSLIQKAQKLREERNAHSSSIKEKPTDENRLKLRGYFLNIYPPLFLSLLLSFFVATSACSSGSIVSFFILFFIKIIVSHHRQGTHFYRTQQMIARARYQSVVF